MLMELLQFNMEVNQMLKKACKNSLAIYRNI